MSAAANAFAPLLGTLHGDTPRVLWRDGALSDNALAENVRLLADAIAASGAQSARDMGTVMAQLRPKVQGRADMADVSRRVKARLGA